MHLLNLSRIVPFTNLLSHVERFNDSSRQDHSVDIFFHKYWFLKRCIKKNLLCLPNTVFSIFTSFDKDSAWWCRRGCTTKRLPNKHKTLAANKICFIVHPSWCQDMCHCTGEAASWRMTACYCCISLWCISWLTGKYSLEL